MPQSENSTIEVPCYAVKKRISYDIESQTLRIYDIGSILGDELAEEYCLAGKKAVAGVIDATPPKKNKAAIGIAIETETLIGIEVSNTARAVSLADAINSRPEI